MKVVLALGVDIYEYMKICASIVRLIENLLCYPQLNHNFQL